MIPNHHTSYGCRTLIVKQNSICLLAYDLTMNPVTIAKFFHIIYNAIFIFLFSIDQIEKGLLGPNSNYFNTVETNSHRMLHLH